MNRTGVYWQLYIDGASRGNPGLSGVGIVILKNGTPFFKKGFFLGIKTNNQAEYYGLLFALFLLKDFYKEGDSVRFFSDSQLLVRQLNGMYQVRNAGIYPLFFLAQKELRMYSGLVTHIMREENKEADAMANKGVDDKVVPHEDILKWLYAHGITV